MSIYIREFVRGPDDGLRVDIYNRSRRDEPFFSTLALDDVRRWNESAFEQRRHRFVAELDGEAAGIAAARIDPEREEKKGFMEELCVVPEQRRRGVGTALARATLEDLHERGAFRVEANEPERDDNRAFLESLGFTVTRSFSHMLRQLDTLPGPFTCPPGVSLATADRLDDGVDTVVRLRNEAFREHYNYRPMAADELLFAEKAAAARGAVSITSLALAGSEPIGYLLFGFDPRRNAALGRNRGTLRDLGVLKPFRRQGVATALITAALARLRTDGMTEVRLYVDNGNQAGAKRLYENLGFADSRRDLVHTLELGKQEYARKEQS